MENYKFISLLLRLPFCPANLFYQATVFQFSYPHPIGMDEIPDSRDMNIRGSILFRS